MASLSSFEQRLGSHDEGFLPKVADVSIAPNRFVGPYHSTWLRICVEKRPEMSGLLENLNCSYFSTRGQAPTLLELKQHAQALLILIKAITVSDEAVAVDDVPEKSRIPAPHRPVVKPGTKPSSSRFQPYQPDPSNIEVNEENDKAVAFDFLANLNTRYTSSDPSHVVALTGLLNSLEDMGVLNRHGRDHCPLHAVQISTPYNDASIKRNQHPLPYATNRQLLKHANDLLERLDHEFSSEGGLLGMLPLPDDSTEHARETNIIGQHSILGQWISFTRSIVVRNHQLEQNLNQVLNIVAGEALIPRQVLYDSTSGGLVHYKTLQEKAENTPQSERFIINIQPGKQVEFAQAFEKLERHQAIIGKPFDPSSVDASKMLLNLSVTTTYSRLRGGQTIFITPTTVTPTAPLPAPIQLVKGEWRDRSSKWELQQYEELDRLRKIELEYAKEKMEFESRKQACDVLMLERKAYLLAGGGVSGKLGITKTVREELKREIYGKEVAAEMKAFEEEKADFERQKKAFEISKKKLEQANVTIEMVREAPTKTIPTKRRRV